MSAPVLAVVGPTASGKTALAIELALRLNCRIVNADSMQIYRGLDKGTAKPTAEQRRRVEFHLVDAVDPREGFSAQRFVELARRAIERIRAAGALPLVCGGTGLYIRALFRGLFSGPAADPELRQELMRRERAEPGALHRRLAQSDPAAAARISPADSVRLVRALEVQMKTGRPISELQAGHAFGQRPFAVRMLGLCPLRPELFRRIDERVERMFADGLVPEVAGLLEQGLDPELPALKAIGYRQVVRHLAGEYDLDEAVRLVKRDTRRLAKRQLTWFRAEPEVRWIEDLRDVDAAMRVLLGEGMAPC